MNEAAGDFAMGERRETGRRGVCIFRGDIPHRTALRQSDAGDEP